MDPVSTLHILRVFVWLLVFVFAWRGRSLLVGGIAIGGAVANGLIGFAGEEAEASIVFMLALPAIAYVLIDYVRAR